MCVLLFTYLFVCLLVSQMLARAFVGGCRPKAEMGTGFNSLNPYDIPSTVLLENREMRRSGDPLKFTEQVNGESWAQRMTLALSPAAFHGAPGKRQAEEITVFAQRVSKKAHGLVFSSETSVCQDNSKRLCIFHV